MSKSMNKYHKCISKHGHLPGWFKTGALALGIAAGVGTEGIPGPGGAQKVRAGKIKNTERMHNTTVNVALQNRYVNFENTNFFLPKTLFFMLPAVARMYFVRKKSKPDNNG